MSRLSRRQGRTSRRVSGGAFQTINITPFTDVLLVLLIIFLIAGSSLSPTGVDVDKLTRLDPSGASVELESKERVLHMALDGKVTLWTSNGITSDPELALLDKTVPLNFTASPGTRVDLVVKVYDELLREGFRDVRLAKPQLTLEL